jgi:hypothetical protein
MPLQKLQFRAGLNREGTDYSNEGGWFDGDNVRFRSGFPEKIGGWTRVSNETYAGVCRCLWSWADENGSGSYIGLGTNLKYYILEGGTYYDITPVINTSGTALPPPNTLGANPLATTTGDPVVAITDSTYSPNIGDYIIINASATVGGINFATAGIINSLGAGTNEYIVTQVKSPTTYTVSSTVIASGTAAGGGTVSIGYENPVGAAIYTQAFGWGAGVWGGGSLTTILTNPFTTTSGSGTISVAQTAHGFTTTAGAFVIGGEYRITTVGTTDFTLIGASSNTVGLLFNATGAGSGTGTASVPWVSFSNATAVGGIPVALLNTTFEIAVTDANTYTILTNGNTGSVHATSSTAGGGTVVVMYQVSPLSEEWGMSASTGTSFSTTIDLQLRLWTNDSYGADLVIAPRGGIISYWTDASGAGSRAQPLTYWAAQAYPYNAPGTSLTYSQFVPNATLQVLASSIQQFIIALGANSYNPSNSETPFNPMLVRWSDQADQFNWVPTATNASGEFALTNGSMIMGGVVTRQENLIWTDSCLYTMQYIGYPYIFSFNVLMDNITCISPNCMITVNNTTYWMGRDKFYMYNGVVQTLPCSLRQYVFDDINQDQAYQVFAGTNEGYNEVWWFYVSNSSLGTTIDKYVIYNYLDHVWSYGSMARTAWFDTGIQPYPLAANYNNMLLYHENGVDDVSGLTPAPIDAYVQSSAFDIGSGDHFSFVWRILPDINFNGSTVNAPSVTMVIQPAQNSGSGYSPADITTVTSANTYSPPSREYTVERYTGQVYTRLRGRQMMFRIESSGQVGVAWQLGVPRMDIKPDGRR